MVTLLKATKLVDLIIYDYHNNAIRYHLNNLPNYQP